MHELSAKCKECGCLFQLGGALVGMILDGEEMVVTCPYCRAIVATDADLFDVESGARFDRDELGVDPEEDRP